jgi:hypothetical protein
VRSEREASRQLVGAINSLGVRRDSTAVPLLTKRLSDDDPNVAAAATAALGKIGAPAAAASAACPSAAKTAGKPSATGCPGTGGSASKASKAPTGSKWCA